MSQLMMKMMPNQNPTMLFTLLLKLSNPAQFLAQSANQKIPVFKLTNQNTAAPQMTSQKQGRQKQAAI